MCAKLNMFSGISANAPCIYYLRDLSIDVIMRAWEIAWLLT